MSIVEKFQVFQRGCECLQGDGVLELTEALALAASVLCLSCPFGDRLAFGLGQRQIPHRNQLLVFIGSHLQIQREDFEA